jgi:hypothetical protein
MAWDPRIRRRLKLRDLDTLIAVAHAGSMAKAAVSLSVSQPAISNAIADMEAILGVRLLDRTTHGVEPTIYGKASRRSNFSAIRQPARCGSAPANPCKAGSFPWSSIA